MDQDSGIEQYIVETNHKIDRLENIIVQQTIAINNLLTAYNQNAVNTNNNQEVVGSILRKVADMEIKSDNNDITTSEILDALSSIKDELNQVASSVQELNLYGGSRW